MGPGLFMNNLHLAVQFFLQLAVILLACRVVGAIAARFGQPQVVAEMITGVCLGPSLFGALAPEWQAWLFPWDATQKARDTSCCRIQFILAVMTKSNSQHSDETATFFFSFFSFFFFFFFLESGKKCCNVTRSCDSLAFPPPR